MGTQKYAIFAKLFKADDKDIRTTVFSCSDAPPAKERTMWLQTIKKSLGEGLLLSKATYDIVITLAHEITPYYYTGNGATVMHRIEEVAKKADSIRIDVKRFSYSQQQSRTFTWIILKL